MKLTAIAVLKMSIVSAVSDVRRESVFHVNAQRSESRSVGLMAIPMEMRVRPHANTSTSPLMVSVSWTWSVQVQTSGVLYSNASE